MLKEPKRIIAEEPTAQEYSVLKADRRCTEKSHEDVSGAPESRETGNTWKNVSEKAGRSGYGSF